VKKIQETCNDKSHESGRPKHARTEENVTAVDNELVGVLNQEDQTQTHRSTHQTDGYNILTSVVNRCDVGLKCLFGLPKRLFPIIGTFINYFTR